MRNDNNHCSYTVGIRLYKGDITPLSFSIYFLPSSVIMLDASRWNHSKGSERKRKSTEQVRAASSSAAHWRVIVDAKAANYCGSHAAQPVGGGEEGLKS